MYARFEQLLELERRHVLKIVFLEAKICYNISCQFVMYIINKYNRLAEWNTRELSLTDNQPFDWAF